MMERINEIWNQLDSSTASVAGLFKQRYSDTSKCDVFLGLKYPENFRMLVLKTPVDIGKDFNFRYQFKGLKFEKVHDPDDSNYLLLNLVLVEKELKDIFNSLIADVLGNIINETEINIILRKYSSRLVKWQSLFERLNQEGLSAEEQRGLFGELFFIRKFLQNNADFLNIIDSWGGPEKQIRDFQFGAWSVEVKTTSGNNHQKIQISSERQLDKNNLDHLFLYHLSLDIRPESGETLNQLVDDVSKLLGTDFTVLNRFQNKLFEGGYLTHHRPFYESTGYFVRGESTFEIEGDFPRIEELDIRSGVGDVKYSIVVSNCKDFLVSDESVYSKMTFV